MYEFCGNMSKIRDFESITLKRWMKREIFLRKGETWENFPWTLKNVQNRRKSETQGAMHYWL